MDKHTRNVASVGAVGGFLTCLFGLWLGHPSHFNFWVDCAVSILLGAGAGVVFVFLIANTDRADAPRLFALALLAGFFWEPVWHGSRALIDRELEQKRVGEAESSAERATRLAKTLATAQGSDRERILQQITEETQRVASLARRIDSVSALTQITTATKPLVDQIRELPATESRSLLAVLGETSVVDNLRYTTVTMPTGGYWLASNNTLATNWETILDQHDFQFRSVPEKLTADDVPPAAEIIEIPIGDATQVPAAGNAKLKWIRIHIPGDGEFEFRATAEGTDLVAALYDRLTLERVGIDDDGGGDRNPKLTVKLVAGEYLLRISAYGDRDLPAFTVLIQGQTDIPAQP